MGQAASTGEARLNGSVCSVCAPILRPDGSGGQAARAREATSPDRKALLSFPSRLTLNSPANLLDLFSPAAARRFLFFNSASNAAPRLMSSSPSKHKSFVARSKNYLRNRLCCFLRSETA